MKKVSVIVPAFNAHDTLSRCLGSLVNQTLQEIEIIVVNDASTDDTWEIIKRCESLFPDKIIAIDSGVNRGSGGARNLALENSSGEFIGFVDSDDFVASDMFEKMYSEAIASDADFVDCGIYSEEAEKSSIFVRDELAGVLSDDKRRTLIMEGGYLVTKLFKRKMFFDPPVRMRERIRCLEDNDILKYMILKAEKISNVKEVLYNYSNTSESQTKNMEMLTYFESIYGVIKGTYELCHDLKNYDKVFDIFEYFYMLWYSYGINRCLYDAIVNYGADTAYIKNYFSEIGEREKNLLRKLAYLKKSIISNDYRNNSEVKNNLSELDIQIMEECDRLF